MLSFETPRNIFSVRQLVVVEFVSVQFLVLVVNTIELYRKISAIQTQNHSRSTNADKHFVQDGTRGNGHRLVQFMHKYFVKEQFLLILLVLCYLWSWCKKENSLL